MTRILEHFTIQPDTGLVLSANELREREKLNTLIFQLSNQGAIYLARQVGTQIKDKQAKGEAIVLGLSTDAALYAVYQEFVRLHKEDGLSFKNVIVYSLCEYYKIDPSSLQSYARHLRENFLDNVDIPTQNVRLLEGTAPIEQVESYLKDYEDSIQKSGGIDVFLLGIQRNGYVGFQQPDTSKASKARLISLDPVTRLDAASEFFGEDAVPKKAITIGLSTIFASRSIYLIAVSEGKARMAKKLIEDQITSDITITNLQNHSSTSVILDIAAATELTRIKCPWMVKNSSIHLKYTPKLIRKAVIWLALTVKKAILKLEDDDYINYNLLDLLTDHGPAHKINIEVFNYMGRTITGWPGGKPKEMLQDNTDEVYANSPKPSREPWAYSTKGGKIFPKDIIIFSPHPDDDVISMGGTLRRLVEQKHNVHVAYQTSGNIAVRDDDSTRFANFVTEYMKVFKLPNLESVSSIEDKVESFIKTKKPAQPDSDEVKHIKGLIRRTEARNAARFCGIPPSNIHFLELPFYETGKVTKKPLGEEDIRIVRELLEKIKPHQIYAAGDLSDPHGTHRVCLKAIMSACYQVKDQDWYKNCQVWLYRGAWQEWDLWDIEMAVPMSPAELYKKRLAIFRHQSQKDTAPFPGTDKREFWERSEARNKQTAKYFDLLGLVEYEGVEAFVTWDVNNPDVVPY